MRWQHCVSSTISHPLYSILSIFGAPFSLHISLPNLSISLPFLAMSSATITNKSESNAAHPLESFHSSMDYQHFESSVIWPFLLQAKLCESVNIHHRTSLSFAPTPGCPSLDGLITLLSETDYNNTTSTIPFPAPSCSDVSSARVEGYFSQAHPDYFVWESGYFEEGSVMFLGGSSCLVKILRVCGVGQNFFKMSVKELGDVLEGETTVQRMIVSFAPIISFHLTFIQCIKQQFLGRFLKSMRDFAESSKDGLGDNVEDDEESGFPGLTTCSYWRNCSDHFVERMTLIVPWWTTKRLALGRARLSGKRTALLLSSSVLSYASPFATLIPFSSPCLSVL